MLGKPFKGIFQMFRLSSKVNTTAKKKAVSFWTSKCSQSTQAGGGKSNGPPLLIGAASVGVIGIGGVFGYASWSDENRKGIESSIPGSSYLLDPILGPLVEVPQRVPPGTTSLMNKKVERERLAKEKEEKFAKQKEDIAAMQKEKTALIAKDPVHSVKDNKKSAPSLPVAPIPLPPVDPIPNAPVVAVAAKPIPDKLEESADLEKRLTVAEINAVAKNESLSKLLEEAIVSAKKQVSGALSAAEEASKAVRNHSEKAYAAIDSGEGQEKLFAIAAEVAKAKSSLIKVAEEKVKSAKEVLFKLESDVSDGRSCKCTQTNPVLSVAEDTLSELSFMMNKINNVVSEAIRDGSAVGEFKDLMEAGRNQFEAEVRSLLPDVAVGEKSEKLTQDELNLLLTHAHRKVLALQKTLAKQQTIDKERYRDSVKRQRENESQVVDTKVQAQLEDQRQELITEHRHRLSQLREDLESEMRLQLKRQAAAHSDHLADVLEVQENDLLGKFENHLNDVVQSEHDKQNRTLSKIRGELDGLKSAVKDRSEVDKAAYAAHELWLACESLRNALRLGSENAVSWEDQLVPLEKHVKLIKNAAGNGDEFVNTILSTLSLTSLQRGVYTEEALRERFIKVDKISKQVAMVGDSGASVFTYLLSYLQNLLIINAFDSMPAKELRDEMIDVESLSTHDIMARARYCLNKDDLTMALRYVNLLKGEPRHIASDWLDEVRLTLEAKQAAEAVRAHAAAQGARAL